MFAWFLNIDALSGSVGVINCCSVQRKSNKTILCPSSILKTGPTQTLMLTPQESHLFGEVLPSLSVAAVAHRALLCA